MDDLAKIIVKHDGVIWGEYVWEKFNDDIKATKISCRFVSINLFSSSANLPKQFLIDLADRFKIIKLKHDCIIVYCEKSKREYMIDMSLYDISGELSHMSTTDFTCNLIEISRIGTSLRTIPLCLASESCPYETVVNQVRNKILQPVHMVKAIDNAEYMISNGWSMKTPETTLMTDMFIDYGSEMYKYHYKDVPVDDKCPVCSQSMKKSELCIRTSCIHVFHLKCIKRWAATSPSCPICREHL
jgi:hypothetical protein